MNKLVAFDFGGVLDVKDSYKIYKDDLDERCMAQIDVDKAFLLFNFVIKHDAKVFCISDLARFVDLWDIIVNSIRFSKKEEHQDAVQYIKENKIELMNMEISLQDRTKQGKINEAAKSNPDAIITAFEDEQKLVNCNHIWISRQNGLTNEDIKEADQKMQ